VTKNQEAGFISYARFRFSLRVTSPMVLPPYKGAVFRGAFGNAFRRLVCLAPKADCLDCILREKCLYIAVFEPPPPPDYADAAKFSQAPRPYVLNPPLTPRQSFRPGETLNFELVLIGPAVDVLPYFIYIFTELGRKGLGRERGKYELIQVDQLKDGQAIPIYAGHTHTLTAFAPEWGPQYLSKDNQVSTVTLEFLTPLRLKEKGDLVTNLGFPLLFERLAQRLTRLAEFYGSPAKLPDFNPLLAQAENITVAQTDLHWYDWARDSQRQRTSIKFGGLRGVISLSGNLEPFMPYLRLVEIMNVGQGTTFGLGKIQLNVG